MCWLSHWPEWSLNTSGRNLVFSRSRFPPRRSDESMSHFFMVRGLVPSTTDVSADPFWGDCGMCSHMIRYKHWSPFSGRMEAPGHCYKEYSVWGWGPFWYDCGMCSHMIRYKCKAILMWLRDSFPLDKMSAMMPFSRRMEAPGQLLGMLSLGMRAILARCVYTWSDVSVEAFQCGVFSHGRM